MTQVRKDNDPLLQFLKVPYICDFNVSAHKDPFQDVSGRHGPRLKTPQHCSSAGLSPDQAAMFFQEWLFFAVLHNICNLVEVEFNTSDFILPCPETGKLIVTGRQFRKYVWLWTGGVSVGTSSSLSRLREQSHAVISMLQTLRNVVDSWEDCQRDGITPSTYLNLVLLSIVQLAAHLKPIVEKVFHVNFENIPFLTTYPKYGRELLLQAGWCVGELPQLLSCYQPFDLLYLSTLDRHRDGTSHSQCSEDGCRAKWLYGKHYKMSHALICDGSLSCEMVKVPINKICAILAAGNIPVLRLSSKTSSASPSLQIEEFPLSGHDQNADGTSTVRYVGISHVWSDGMGNPSDNGLYACQLHRIQRAVNGLYSSEKDTPAENVLFWCDTLLVPTSGKFRSLAISQMARTYLHADKVLVLDSWLTRSSISAEGPKHLLLKVLHSDWSTRLWTYHEMVLAKECYFQFADSTLTIYELQDAVENLEIEPLGELQAILSGFKEDDILNTKSTLSLLQALIHLEPRRMDHHMEKWAALPPEKDPRWDLERMITVHNEAWNDMCCKILEKWFPILTEADRLSSDPEEDAFRLKDLILRIPSHPVKIEPSSMGERQFMSGYSHGIDRSLDLACDKASFSRLIIGMAGTPSERLATMVAGSRGRITSWKEDETICLGGIIGLDVSPLAQVRVTDTENRPEEQVSQVCEARMKIFLSTVRKFSESILFWPSAKRLPTYPWRWAPASFLDEDGELRLETSYAGECTEEGFLCEFDSVKLSLVLNQKNNYPVLPTDMEECYFRQRTPRKKYYVPVEADREQTSIPNADTNLPFVDVFYRANIRTLFPGTECSSWRTFFTQPAKDLYLLRSSRGHSKRRIDAVLVRHLETRGDTRLGYCLGTVQLLQMLKTRPEYFIDSELEAIKKKWCVG